MNFIYKYDVCKWSTNKAEKQRALLLEIFKYM